MAGGPRVPASEVPKDAVRLRTPIGDLSRKALVRLILHGVLVLSVVGTAIYAFWSAQNVGVIPGDETAVGVVFCLVVVLLLVLNRLGHWRLATWSLLVLLVLNGSLFFNLASLDRVPGFNWISLLALTGLALVSWLLARRLEWLEESEDMSQRELDRLADERDVLKGQIRALADEVDRLRASEGASEDSQDLVGV
jgi:hypothetical protein